VALCTHHRNHRLDCSAPCHGCHRGRLEGSWHGSRRRGICGHQHRRRGCRPSRRLADRSPSPQSLARFARSRWRIRWLNIEEFTCSIFEFLFSETYPPLARRPPSCTEVGNRRRSARQGLRQAADWDYRRRERCRIPTGLSELSKCAVVTRRTLATADPFLRFCGPGFFLLLKQFCSLVEKTEPIFFLVETRNDHVAALSPLRVVPIVVDDPPALGVIVCINEPHKKSVRATGEGDVVL
jgi:hypothetical protein